MGYGEQKYSDLLIYALGMALAAAVALAPQTASSGFEAGGTPDAGPRWSNDHHTADSVVVSPSGCVFPSPSQQAEYVPGRDAWGNPVAPADNYTGHPNALPLELDVHLGRKHLGGHLVDLHTHPSAFPPANTLPRDCTPYFK